MKRCKSVVKLVFMGVIAILPTLTNAGATAWKDSVLSGYWDGPANWDNNVPVVQDTVTVAKTSTKVTVTITNGVAAVADRIDLAYTKSAKGAMIMTGGSLTAARIHMSTTSATSTFDFSTGTVSIVDGRIGVYGTGTFTQTGGDVLGTYWILGHYSPAKGTYNHSGGTATFSVSAFTLGYNTNTIGTYKISGEAVLNANAGILISNGSGIIEQNGGTINAGSSVTLGNGSISSGTLVLNDGAFNTLTMYVGVAGYGSVTQSAGTATISNLRVLTGNGVGYYKLLDGTLSCINQFIGAGPNAVGLFEQYGGTNLTSGWLNVGVTNGAYAMYGGEMQAGNFLIGGYAAGISAATGTVLLAGGTITAPTEIRVGSYGNGTLMQTNGTLICQGNLEVGMRAGSVGKYVQSGGTAVLQAVVICRDVGSIDSRYEISGGSASMASLSVANGSGRGGTFAIMGTNAGVAVAGRMLIGASGTYEVALTPAGVTAPSASTFSLSSLSSLKVKASGLLPYAMDNTEIPIVTFDSRDEIPFGTVTVETGAEYGELKSATVNYYADRVTLKVRVCRPPQGAVITIF